MTSINRPELNKVLGERSLTIVKPTLEVPSTTINQSAPLLELENDIAQSIASLGGKVLLLNSKQNREFIASRGAFSLFRMALPTKRDNGRPQEAYGVLIPQDTTFSNGQGSLRFAFIARYAEGKFSVPPEHDPLFTKINPEDSEDEIMITLSAASQMRLSGRHNPSTRVPIADALHIETVLAGANVDSEAGNTIKSVSTEDKPHVGDAMEQQQNLGLLGAISARDLSERGRDLISIPVSYTVKYDLTQTPYFAIVLTRNVLDLSQLAQGRIKPIAANYPDALDRIGEMSFSTLLKKDREGLVDDESSSAKRITRTDLFKRTLDNTQRNGYLV